MDQYKIISLCASYIHTEERLAHFFAMLTSWVNQETMLCSMYIATSIIDDELLNKFTTLFEDFKTRYAEDLTGIVLEVSIVRKQRQQFQHYKYIIDKHPVLVKRNPWVLFTDDDDIWHPNRLAMYCSAIQRILDEKLVDIDNILCPYYVESIGIDTYDYSTSSDIDKGILLGSIQQNKSDVNYVFHCVRMERFHYFLTHSTEELLDCVYADTRFCYFMRSEGTEYGKQSMNITECWENGWMYFYRHVGDPLGSITNNTNRLPNCVSYTKELKVKFENLRSDSEYKKILVSLLNFIELYICLGEKDMRDIFKKYEVYNLEMGTPVAYIVKSIRPLYSIVEEFLEHPYYINLRKHIDQMTTKPPAFRTPPPHTPSQEWYTVEYSHAAGSPTTPAGVPQQSHGSSS